MERISLRAPAKINLSLRVLGKRPDGYHEIESLMQAISLYDEITLVRSDAIGIACDDHSIPSDETNLAFKAASLFQSRYKIPGVSIRLKKGIPSGAGLGGGSSDAAFVLRGLCGLYDINPAETELYGLAALLGSDVPFFLSRGQAIAQGRGEKLIPISLPLDYEIVIISPNISISTASVYGAIKKYLTTKSILPLLPANISISSFVGLTNQFGDDLETVVLQTYPNLNDLKRSLLGAGAFYSSMTGSGSSFFGLFLPGTLKLSEMEQPEERNYRVFRCRPILLPLLGA